MPVFDKLVAEMRTRPFSMVLLLGLWAIVVLTIATNYGLASEQQVQGIAAQVQSATAQVVALSNTVKRSGLDTRLDQKKSELFSLQQKVNEMNNAHKPVDSFYAARIAELTDEITELQKERDALR